MTNNLDRVCTLRPVNVPAASTPAESSVTSEESIHAVIASAAGSPVMLIETAKDRKNRLARERRAAKKAAATIVV